ncbi:MAG: hypothetical protein P8X68_05280 [Desulfobacterales bacterium]
MEKTYDIQAIMNFLPHRYPFILVDRILELIHGEKITALKPVVPGDQLVFEVQILKFRSKVVKAAGKALVEGQVVAEAELMASLG